MLTQELAVTIKVLKKQGMPTKAIARELGIARNTVKKYLNQEDWKPKYVRTSPRPSKLDPFKAYINQRIEDAKPDWIPAAVLFQEIIELGYTGKIRILSSYIAQFKPVPKADPVVRFETPPGLQIQVDFTVVRRQKPVLKAFVATLGYSRATFVHFYDHERSEAWLDGLRRAFDFFGGVPKEVLFDNAKTIMIKRDALGDGQHRWHPALAQLAKDYGFKPRVCKPYRAKTKGKVERFNGYLKRSFIVPLRATLNRAKLQLDVQAANGHIGPWLHKTANAREHGTTKIVPNHRLHEEQALFLPLPLTHGNQASSERQTTKVAMPHESLQHPLSMYDKVIGVQYESSI